MVKLFASRGGIVAAASCSISQHLRGFSRRFSREDSINVIQFPVIASDCFVLDNIVVICRIIICIDNGHSNLVNYKWSLLNQVSRINPEMREWVCIKNSGDRAAAIVPLANSCIEADTNVLRQQSKWVTRSIWIFNFAFSHPLVRSHTSLVPHFAINVPYPKGALKNGIAKGKVKVNFLRRIKTVRTVERGVERMAFLLG